MMSGTDGKISLASHVRSGRGQAIAKKVRCFSKQNASGPDIVVVTQTLSNGRADVSEALGATTMYDVTLVNRFAATNLPEQGRTSTSPVAYLETDSTPLQR
jgi:hypothetical protein